MGLFNKKQTTWRSAHVPYNDTQKPPPFPPSRIFYESGRETKQSAQDREDWETYMAGYNHGLKMGKN